MVSEFLLKHKIVVFITSTILAFVLTIIVYHILFYTYITAKFDELRPFREKLEVYYKGFKIGETGRIRPSKDYKNTLMEIILYPANLKLPKNTVMKVKSEKRGREKVDFVDVIYPDDPDITMLKNGDVVQGIGTVDFESFLASIDPESLDEMQQDLQKTVKSMQGTIEALGQLFGAFEEIVRENQPNIKATTNNLVQTSKNFKEASEKVNKSLAQESLNGSVSNVNSSTENILETTKKMRLIGENIDTLTNSLNENMPEITASVNEMGCILRTINGITCGVSKTLKKRMGGMRLFFGKAVDEECHCDCK